MRVTAYQACLDPEIAPLRAPAVMTDVDGTVCSLVIGQFQNHFLRELTLDFFSQF